MSYELEQRIQRARLRDREWIRAHVAAKDAEISQLKAEVEALKSKFTALLGDE